MNDAAWLAFNDAAWERMPVALRDEAVAYLKTRFTEQAVADMQARMRENRAGWIMGRGNEFPLHLGWGMAIRNALRRAGFTDDAFGENLDDLYVPLVEAACRMRPWPAPDAGEGAEAL